MKKNEKRRVKKKNGRGEGKLLVGGNIKRFIYFYTQLFRKL